MSEHEPFLPAVQIDAVPHDRSFCVSRSMFLLGISVSAIFIIMFLMSYGFTNWTLGAASVQRPFAVMMRNSVPFDPESAFVDLNLVNDSLPCCPDFAAYATDGLPRASEPVTAPQLLRDAHAARDPRVYDLMSACMRTGLNISRPDDDAFARELVDRVPSNRGAGYIFGMLATQGISAPLSVSIDINPANVHEPVVRWRPSALPFGPGDFERACEALFALERFNYELFVSAEECGRSMAELNAPLREAATLAQASSVAETYEYFHHGAANHTYTLEQLKGAAGPGFVGGAAAAVQHEIGLHRADIETAGRSVPQIDLLPHWTPYTEYLAHLANFTGGISPERWRVFGQTVLLLDGMQVGANVMQEMEPNQIEPGTNVTVIAFQKISEECTWLAANYLPRQTAALLREVRGTAGARQVGEIVRSAFLRWTERSSADASTKLEISRKLHAMRIVDGGEPDSPLDAGLRFPAHPSLHRIVHAGRRALWARVLVEGPRAARDTPILDAAAPVAYYPSTNTLVVSGAAGGRLFRPGWPRSHVMGTLGFEMARAMLGVASSERLAPDALGQVGVNYALSDALYANEAASRDLAAAEVALMACNESSEDARQFMLALAQHLSGQADRINSIAGRLQLHGERPWCSATYETGPL